MLKGEQDRYGAYLIQAGQKAREDAKRWGVEMTNTPDEVPAVREDMLGRFGEAVTKMDVLGRLYHETATTAIKNIR